MTDFSSQGTISPLQEMFQSLYAPGPGGPGPGAGSSSSLYPAYVQSEPVAQFLWKLPKWGEKHEGCGDIKTKIGCLDRTHTKSSRAIKFHCFRPECPECYSAWATRDADRAARRLVGGEDLYHQVGYPLGPVRHFVYSPPQDQAIEQIKTEKGFKDLREQANQVIKLSGMKGWTLMFHPWRKKHDDDGTECSDRWTPGKGECTRSHHWEIGPHFHILGYGWIMKSDEFNEQTGWVYKNLGLRDSVLGTIWYLLTHVGLGYRDEERVFHVLTWNGCISYSTLCKDTIRPDVEQDHCQECGKVLHEFGPDGDQDWGEYSRKVKIIRFKLRKYPCVQVTFTEEEDPGGLRQWKKIKKHKT